MKTIRGIELDLNTSEFYVDYLSFRFYFSSQVYLKKFIDGVKDYVCTENLKIKTRYNIEIDLGVFFIFSFYKKIEKRGFRVYDICNKKEVTENLLLTSILIKY